MSNKTPTPIDFVDFSKDHETKIQSQQLINERENERYKSNRIPGLETDRARTEEEEARKNTFGFLSIAYWRVFLKGLFQLQSVGNAQKNHVHRHFSVNRERHFRKTRFIQSALD